MIRYSSMPLYLTFETRVLELASRAIATESEVVLHRFLSRDPCQLGPLELVEDLDIVPMGTHWKKSDENATVSVNLSRLASGLAGH
jgi:hypothetical protein